MKTKKLQNKITRVESIIGVSRGVIGFMNKLQVIEEYLPAGATINLGPPPMLIIYQNTTTSGNAALYFAHNNKIILVAGHDFGNIFTSNFSEGVIFTNTASVAQGCNITILGSRL